MIGVDDFVHGDDAQSKALGLAYEHAVEGIGMVFGKFLQQAAVVDVWSESRHAVALQFVRVKLVPVVGDFEFESLAGDVQQSREEMEVIFTLLAERYERRSLLISSNLVFGQWDQIFQDPMTTMAAIDRKRGKSAPR